MKNKAGFYLTLFFTLLLISFLFTVLFANRQQKDIRSRAQVVVPSPGGAGACDVIRLGLRDQCTPSRSAFDAIQFNFADFQCSGDDIAIMRTVGSVVTCRTEAELRALAAAQCQQICLGTPAVTPPIELPETPSDVPTETPQCQEGVNIPLKLILKECQSTSPPTGVVRILPPASVYDLTPTPSPVVTYQLDGIVCADGSTDTSFTLPCSQKNEIDKIITDSAKLATLCRGRRSPGCAVKTTISPVKNCSTKSNGDCTCDSRVDLADFECWRRQFIGEESCNTADFNGDLLCRLSEDWEILRNNLMR